MALVVVFQPELRSALEKVGGEPLKSLRNIGENKDVQSSVSPYINEICRAAEELSASKTGALIVLERSTKLGDIIKTGVTVNADISAFMLKNIFYNGAPLHDGAVIIRSWRIYAQAASFHSLPMKISLWISARDHRAGIGMSEESDAAVIIVSEETGNISVAVGGQLKRGYTYNSLKRELENMFSISPSKRVNTIMTYIKKDQK